MLHDFVKLSVTVKHIVYLPQLLYIFWFVERVECQMI